MALSTTTKSIQDIMWKDVGVHGDAQRISQLDWMRLLKILDDRKVKQESLHDDYTSFIPNELRWRSWAPEEEATTVAAMQAFVDTQLFPTLNEQSAEGPAARRALLIRELFSDAYNELKSDTLIRQLINTLNQGIDFSNSKTPHPLGDIYEHILRRLHSASDVDQHDPGRHRDSG